MSGPKVVRIVTREELVDICLGHLARVDAALSEWARVGKRNNCLSDAEIAAAQVRRDALARLLDRDRFAEIQKQASQEIAYLHGDLQERLARMVAEAVAARSIERRQAEAAVALLSALAKAGRAVSSELEMALQKAATGAPDPAAISAGFALLSTEREDGMADQRALAARHGEGLRRQTYTDWLDLQSTAAPDPVVAALDRSLSELLVMAPDQVSGFDSRIRTVEAESGSRRVLLLDSLSMDLGRVVGEVRERAKSQSKLALVLAELKLIDPAQSGTLAQQSGGAVQKAALDELLMLAEASLATARAERAAELRRSAVLASLAGLGYEVSEGMATAWVEDGRLVVRSAARPEYGMEIGGDMSLERVQMRAVAFSNAAAPVDRARDAGAETLWCKDVAALQGELAALGGGLVIERDLAIGSTPLKRVADPAIVDRHRAIEGPAQGTRTVR